MGSVNKVILVGNLGRDAELRYTPGGAAVATLNMATTEVWNDKAGQKQEKTEWHRVILWGKSAESLNEYLTKGSRSTSRDGCRRGSGTTRTATSATPRRSAATASCCSVGVEAGDGRRRMSRSGSHDDGRSRRRPQPGRVRAADRRRHPLLTNWHCTLHCGLNEQSIRDVQFAIAVFLTPWRPPFRIGLPAARHRAAPAWTLRRCRCLRSPSCGAPFSA